MKDAVRALIIFIVFLTTYIFAADGAPKVEKISETFYRAQIKPDLYFCMEKLDGQSKERLGQFIARQENVLQNDSKLHYSASRKGSVLQDPCIAAGGRSY